MTYDINASHHQQELEAEAQHERLVNLARAGQHRDSAVSRAREALGLGIVGLGLALAGDASRRRAGERPGPHSIAI